jgi:hypothetical protein
LENQQMWREVNVDMKDPLGRMKKDMEDMEKT